MSDKSTGKRKDCHQNNEVKRLKSSGISSQAYRRRSSSAASIESGNIIIGCPEGLKNHAPTNSEEGAHNLKLQASPVLTVINTPSEVGEAEQAYEVVEIDKKPYLLNGTSLSPLHRSAAELSLRSSPANFSRDESWATVVHDQNESFTRVRVLDKVDSEIRFQIPVPNIEAKILQTYDVYHIRTRHGSYMQMKPEAFIEFCLDLVWSGPFSYNETFNKASHNLQQGMVSANHCIEALLACCYFGPYNPNDDA